MCGNTRTASAISDEKYTPEQRAEVTRAGAAKLFEKLKKGPTRPGQFPFNDGMKPELHFSISTDFLQPDPRVQETSYQVMKAWVEASGEPLISMVTKGVPYSADMRARFLALFKAHPDQISYQCTCASVDKAAQKLVEPGAPEPEERFKFLEEVIHTAGVKRVSLRMNPLIPAVNDAKDLLAATLHRAAAAGVKRAACSYVYGSPVIFRNLQKFCKLNLRPLMRCEAGLSGGSKKFQASTELRKDTTEWARRFGSELGIVVSSCGCDAKVCSFANFANSPDNAKDLYGSDKCGISWRSGGPNLEPTGEPSYAEAKKIQAEIEKDERNSP